MRDADDFAIFRLRAERFAASFWNDRHRQPRRMRLIRWVCWCRKLGTATVAQDGLTMSRSPDCPSRSTT